jgi:hypothetical protein
MRLKRMNDAVAGRADHSHSLTGLGLVRRTQEAILVGEDARQIGSTSGRGRAGMHICSSSKCRDCVQNCGLHLKFVHYH